MTDEEIKKYKKIFQEVLDSNGKRCVAKRSDCENCPCRTSCIDSEELFKSVKEWFKLFETAKKYTIAEIRAMFKKSHEVLDLSMSRFRPWQYSDSLTESVFSAYEQAFIDLGLLKE